MVRNDVKVLSKNEQEIYINSGNNIESLSIVNLIHGYCSSTRSKLSVVPESIDVLIERNCWEDWEMFQRRVKNCK